MQNTKLQQAAAIARETFRRKEAERAVCPECIANKGKMHPSHHGSSMCESGSIASGGTRAHCSCNACF
jgi:hypothetical protein